MKTTTTENKNVVIIGVTVDTAVVVSAPGIYDGLSKGKVSCATTVRSENPFDDCVSFDLEQPSDSILFRECDIPMLIQRGGIPIPIEIERAFDIASTLKLPAGLIIVYRGDKTNISVGYNTSTAKDSPTFDVIIYHIED